MTTILIGKPSAIEMWVDKLLFVWLVFLLSGKEQNHVQYNPN